MLCRPWLPTEGIGPCTRRHSTTQRSPCLIIFQVRHASRLKTSQVFARAERRNERMDGAIGFCACAPCPGGPKDSEKPLRNDIVRHVCATRCVFTCQSPVICILCLLFCARVFPQKPVWMEAYPRMAHIVSPDSTVDCTYILSFSVFSAPSISKRRL